MTRKLWRMLAALYIGGSAIAVPLVTTTAVPAGATEQVGRWYNPPVVVSDGAHDANVQDGAYYWQDRGFPGFYPPLPVVVGGSRCATPYDGEIMVCEVDPSIVQAYSCAYGGGCGTDVIGATVRYFDYSYRPARIIRGFTLIANNLDPSTRQFVYRHELGHELGLGHSTNPACIMYLHPVWAGSSCSDDILAMQGLYYNPPHW